MNIFVPNVPVAVVSILDKSTYSREVHPLNILASAVVDEMEVNELRFILFNACPSLIKSSLKVKVSTVFSCIIQS